MEAAPEEAGCRAMCAGARSWAARAGQRGLAVPASLLQGGLGFVGPRSRSPWKVITQGWFKSEEGKALL